MSRRLMAGIKPTFQIEAFSAALDAQRLSKKMTWFQVSQASGVGAATLCRMTKSGKRPDIDGLAALLRWSGLKAEQFISPGAGGPRNKPEALAQIVALVRADPRLADAYKPVFEGVLRAAYRRLARSN